MNVEKKRSGSKLEVTVSGKINAVSAPVFEQDMESALDGITELSIDLQSVDYISSAGLRVLLYLQQVMEEKGSMVLRSVPPIVMEIFELTGFNEIVTIE